jgi:hypothetical protein
MKKLILVLAILLAVPAFGALSISLTQQGTSNLVDLNYADACSTNLPRAFALKIDVDSPAKITDVTNFKIGESNSANPGYGIYPARITIEANGTVTDWGTPLAAPGDPGAGNGQGTNNIVLEFGSLYVGDGNAPATSGTLCTLTMDCNGATGNVNIVATEEDTYRGGVVLEDGDTPDPNLTASLPYACAAPLPGQATLNSPPADGATCVSTTPTLGWTAGSDANSHIVNLGIGSPQYVCEQSGTSYTPSTPLAKNTTYYWRIDEKNDSGTTTGTTVWSFTTLPAAPGKASIGTPTNHATCIPSAGTTLTWTGDGNAAPSNGYDVWFGLTSPGTEKGWQTNASYPTGAMTAGRTYYWRIDEKNACGTITQGTVWDFNTAPAYTQAITPSPAIGGSAPIDANLSWVAGSNATSHDVYFGTANPPTAAQFKGNQALAANKYDPNGNVPGSGNRSMTPSTHYYWRIDEKNACGTTTTGTVWDFITDSNCFPHANPQFAKWIALGKPASWCYLRQCHGDATGSTEGGGKNPTVWVGGADLAIVATAWHTTGPGDVNVNGDTKFNAAADFDHKTEGGGKNPTYRVGGADLSIIALYWKDTTEVPGIPPIADPNCLN